MDYGKPVRAVGPSHIGTLPIQVALHEAAQCYDTPPTQTQLEKGVFYRGFFLWIEGAHVRALANGYKQAGPFAVCWEYALTSTSLTIDEICDSGFETFKNGPGGRTAQVYAHYVSAYRAQQPFDVFPWEIHAIPDPEARRAARASYQHEALQR